MASRPTQTESTLGVAVQTQPRCKICSSRHRGDIEDFLVMRHRGTLYEGTAMTWDRFYAGSQEWWGFKLNKMNVKRHWDSHFKMGGGVEKKQAEAKQALVDRSLAGDVERVAVDDYLERVVDLAAMRAKLDPGSVTIDQGLKAAAELTKRKADDSRLRLMEQVIAGRSAGLGLSNTPQVESENAIVVEAIVVEEETVAAESGE